MPGRRLGIHAGAFLGFALCPFCVPVLAGGRASGLAAALDVPAAALLAEGAIPESAGARGETLGRINDHLARTTDADLERVERMLGAFVRG